MLISRVKGTRDLLESDSALFSKVISVFSQFTTNAGYSLVILPSLEESSLYTRTLGLSSDIVMKEMFHIKDQAYVLRPEGTAGAIRAYLTNCSQSESKKWSYCGAMFRHERPQSGRYREFFQFGIENIGPKVSGIIDAEVISIAYQVLKELKLHSVLNLNTLGDEASKKNYAEVLKNYFKGKKISELSSKRISQGNFLRVLDSKEEEDQEALKDCPRINESLSESAANYYKEVKTVLDCLEVPYEENPRLVRGLDYYSNACFEFINSSNKAIIGGGRYDNLGKIIQSGKNASGIGWAAGIDRICDEFQYREQRFVVGIAPVGSHNTLECLKIAVKLREIGKYEVYLKTEADSLKQHLNAFKKKELNFVVFVGDDELADGKVKLKNWKNGEQSVVDLSELLKNPSDFLRGQNN